MTSSWFQDLSALTASVQATVESSLPTTLPSATDMLESLTLTTPELAEERRRIDQEEKRKLNVKHALAGLLPWETRDTERDILVEECREAMLQLSHHKETFFGPFVMPEQTAKIENTAEDDGGDAEQQEAVKRSEQPSPESIEKLEQLKPLPPLLHNFDFQAHVGLIERILAEDPNLVEMQSKLSGKLLFISGFTMGLLCSFILDVCVYVRMCVYILGGGQRERVFWRNYFFHCAYTRYEAGLSLDEIWNEEYTLPEASPSDGGEAGEETITFDAEPVANKLPSTPPESTEYEIVDNGSNNKDSTTVDEDVDAVVDEDEIDFSGVENNEDVTLDSGDYELDELEAEIARELED